MKNSSFPSHPGVYQFFDASGKWLYVGKAKNLKKRIASYFRQNGLDHKVQTMMQKVHDIKVIITENENQALLLEAELIKQHHPRYNVIFRDDKSYPYLLLSDHVFPRLDYARRKKREVGRYFGPYATIGSVRDNLALIQKLFQLRQCRDIFFKNRTRPCLQYQIHRCTAPCVGYVSESEYQQQAQDAVLFLQGKNKAVLQSIQKRMKTAAQEQNFEKAAHERDLLMRLYQLQDQAFLQDIKLDDYLHQQDQYLTKWIAFQTFLTTLTMPQVVNRIECFDISHTSGDETKASCVVFDASGPVKKMYRQFNIGNITLSDDYAAMKQVLMRRCLRLISQRETLPDVIMIDGGKGQLKQAELVLSSFKTKLTNTHIILLAVAKGASRKPGLEKLYFSGKQSAVQLPSDHPALHFIQMIRDEAHRFAITAHRKKLRKRFQKPS